MQTLDKENLILALENAWQEMIDWVNQQPEAEFNQPLQAGKWSTAQTLYHLSKIARPINAGLKAPKLILRGMYGKNNRKEKSYEEIVAHFNDLMQSDGVSPLKYVAKKDRIFDKDSLIKRFQSEWIDCKKHLKKWNEKSLSNYILPHPEMNKSTVREILYYNIWHTKHHLKIMQKQAQLSASNIS